MITNSGLWITKKCGVPSILDVAVHLSRVNRWGGAIIPFPVLIHSLVVSKLCRGEAVGPALLHDCVEAVTSDIPAEFKTEEQKELEEVLIRRFFEFWNIEWPKDEIWDEIKRADVRSRSAEALFFGIASQNLKVTDTDSEAINEIKFLVNGYGPSDIWTKEHSSLQKYFISQVIKNFPNINLSGKSCDYVGY